MIPYHSDPWLTVYQGDCREVMAQMEPESVHCVVTSPPYWGLRDYGTATWIGGDDGCDHLGPPHASGNSTLKNDGRPQDRVGQNNYDREARTPFKDTCRKCGAVRQDSQLGLEPTPEQYVENMVAVFREVRRVLRKDGTCWVNLGDSYWNGGGEKRDGGHGFVDGGKPKLDAAKGALLQMPSSTGLGLKPKDLVGIPWRVAFALQADGWYLRSDIIWSKPNPMPESVTDRPTKAHEYLFLLTKSPRYYYDADAVREGLAVPLHAPGNLQRFTGGGQDFDDDSADRIWGNPAGRNLRTVWTIATQPYPGAHFATFPEALVEPCVKAGTSERGVCPECGAPWTREVERERIADHVTTLPGKTMDGPYASQVTTGDQDIRNGLSVKVTTTGWRPSCASTCPGLYEFGPPIPATVLDPFAGSGTTGRVAQRLGRKAVLIDLSGEYLQQLMVRNADIPLGLAEGTGA